MSSVDVINYGACIFTTALNLLTRLTRARDMGREPQLIIVDLRKARDYKDGHILTALSLNCSTKPMTKRSLMCWDEMFETNDGCPAPFHFTQKSLCTQISNIDGPDIVLYDQCSAVLPDVDSSMRQFIDGLLARGNSLFILCGELTST